MKKLLMALLIVLFVIVSGCSLKGDSSREKNTPEDITIYNGVNFKNKTVEYLEYLENYRNVKLNPVSREFFTEIKTLDGLLRIQMYEYIYYFKERHNLLLPLNDILNESSSMLDIPEGIMNAVTDDNGDIWAILLSHRFDTRSRVFNKEMMEQLGVDIPRTTNDLMELLMLTKEVFDGDIIIVNKDNCAEMFYDVFAYFQCATINGRFTIGWDEEKHLYMDHVDTYEMIQSLQFIKELDAAGLISTTLNNENPETEAYINNEVFTTVMSNKYGLSEKYSSYGFTGSNFLLEAWEENSYIYVVPNGTTNPDKKVNDFISIFYEDEQMNKTGFHGIEGESYAYINPEFIKKINPVTYYSPGTSDCWITNFYIPLSYKENKADYEFWLNNQWNKIQEDYYKGAFRVLPIDKTLGFAERIHNSRDIHYAFSRMLYKFIDEDMSVAQFIKEYEEKQKKFGIEDYLDVLNGVN